MGQNDENYGKKIEIQENYNWKKSELKILEKIIMIDILLNVTNL